MILAVSSLEMATISVLTMKIHLEVLLLAMRTLG